MLVQELIDYIGQSHYLPGDEALNCDESEAKVKAHITCMHTRMPFDPQNYLPGEQQSYAREWLPAASQSGEAHSDFVQPLPFEMPSTLLLESLQRFWAHPVRAFFQMRLRVNFRAQESEIPDTEPFTLEGLTRYQINQQLLNTLVEQEDAERLFRRFRAAGELPYGAFGEILWETQCQEMQQLADRVIACRLPGQSMEVDLNCNGVQLTYWLPQVQTMVYCVGDHRCLAFHKACNFGWNILSIAPVVVQGKAVCFYVKMANGVSHHWKQNRRYITLRSL